MISDKFRISIASLALYAATLALALTAAWQHISNPLLAGGVGPLELTVQNGILFLAVFVVFTVMMVRFVRVARASLMLFLLIALVAGTQFILAAWVPYPYELIGALFMAALLWVVPRVLVHDIAVMAGIGGIAAVLGLSMTPLVACALLAVLSIYDIVSVYRTRHMVTLAGRMLESGAVFGFLIPARIRGLFARRDEALRERSVMMLGSGDIGLPLVLAASALSQSILSAVLVSAFALLGVMGMHWLFSHQRRPAPMAALPPIAMASIIGYVVSLLF